MKKSQAKINNVSSQDCYTYAFGCIDGSRYSPGADRDHDEGFDFAPFEPGSCGNAYKDATFSRGGGSLIVLAHGAVNLDGRLNADAVLNGSYSGPAGGSIWIAGDTIACGEELIATARGAAGGHGAYGAGTGGRIAFMTDVTTAEQIEDLVGGTKLEGFTYAALTLLGVSVDGGRRNPTDAQPAGKTGTAVSAFSNASYELVTVTASPLEAVSAKAGYGKIQVRGGETVVREADAIGGDPVDPQNVRYVCTGYVVSNATEQVAEGKTTTLSFPVVKGTGPYTVTWLWGIRQTRTQLSVTGSGAVTVNGQTVGESWIPDTEDVVFVATPDADKAFWTWSGVDVPAASVAKTTFTIPANKPHVVRAVFVDLSAEAKTCTFKTTASGDFYDIANWEDALAPNPQDAVVIPGGTCTALGRFACASLTMSGGSLSVAQVEEVSIPGGVALSGGSVWTVTAVPTNTATAFADGATRVKIGGDLVMEDAATVKPVSDPWTGGSVAFSVAGDFTLGEAAKFNAVGTGWGWVEYTGDPSPCAVDKTTVNGFTLQTMAVGRGNSFSIGGSYGGRGGSRPATGWTYGFANAPIHAGSPNGVHSVVGGYTTYCGGGLIRVHVGGLATVNGTLDASGPVVTFGGPSGGGVWLTAEEFAFGETAKLLAKGGGSGYSAQGGGGRIAIGTGLTAAQMASLKQTGACSRRAKDVELFKQDFPGVTVDVTLGNNSGDWKTDGEDGTFSYYPTPKGLLLLVK